MSVITESANSATWDIDLKSGLEIADIINEEDKKVALAVEKALPQIGEAIDKISERLRAGGRMAYFGSGTSGRIGILDASEMPPTYGVSLDLIQGYISGGEKAIRFSVENAEDSEELAEEDLADFNPQANDVVVVISASGGSRYGLHILQSAGERGILTIAVTSNPEAKFKDFCDIFICTVVGPEAITGSSRMKSGTAQKMVLNMLSTGAMIRLGKTYHNYMVDLRINNIKLHKRAIDFVCEITGTDEKTAAETIDKCNNVKTACVMIKRNCSKEEAEKLLSRNEGILRKII
ncbi:MAG: N-acetylmuramic acid 6-phosphate etherase [Alphaproteobacteria bacterium]|nr:N-acetylmuramic acid 6-phosphate etherase [Alphaproteobacteria bacterium]